MTICVNDIKGITLLELEYYRVDDIKLIAEFVTVNGRSGTIIPTGKNDKAKSFELYIPIFGSDKTKSMAAEIIWD